MGIVTSLYKAHSCRSASTSKVKILGMSHKDIKKRSLVGGIDLAKAL